jgi:pimeloyl-ACP methyl ester carboxylesterase
MNTQPRDVTVQPPSPPAPGETAAGPAAPERDDLRPQPYLRTGTGAHGLRRRLMGWLFGWSWFDRVTAFLLRRVFFPTSRLLAAAQVADGEPQAFCAAVPMPARYDDAPHQMRTLARVEQARARVRALDTAWERAVFGAGDVSVVERAAIEAARLDASQALNATRRLFAGYLLRGIPRARMAVAAPSAVEAIYGNARESFEPFVAPPANMPPVHVSRAIPGTVGRDHWLRFASPSPRLRDSVTARVHEPMGVANPPTIILGHGICIEFDHWRGLVDETDELVAMGIRVIRPEAPWHGRRAKPGMFGGEPIVAEFPLGSLDAFTGALQEWAVLADWARATSSGPLLMGGTSLGAQMAQLCARYAKSWPEHLRPQALLLITHCGSMADAVLKGAMPEIFGTAADVADRGWTPQAIQSWLSLLDPGPDAPLDPSRIVSVLGRYDRITPFASGEALAQAWRVPPENLFILDRGHFSVPMTLIRNPAPLRRFRAIVKDLQR